MKATAKERKPELRFLPATVGQMVDLRDSLLARDVVPEQAHGLVAWVAVLAGGGEDVTARPTRVAYRRILRSMETPSWSTSEAAKGAAGATAA